MPVPLFTDSHTHLDSQEFANEVDAVVARARDAGVRRIVTIGAGRGMDSMRNAHRLAHTYPDVWATAGIHPHDAGDPYDLEMLRHHASDPRVVAVGETGLDFYRNLAPKEAQERCFRAQIEIAIELGKPLVIHSREAGQACLDILREMGADRIGGVFHCYAEDAAFARRLAEMNFAVSYGGAITFKKADATREIVKAIPLTQILLETDAPYLAPEPFRGTRCESALMVHTAARLAELHGVTVDELAKVTNGNVERVFRLPPLEG